MRTPAPSRRVRPLWPDRVLRSWTLRTCGARGARDAGTPGRGGARPAAITEPRTGNGGEVSWPGVALARVRQVPSSRPRSWRRQAGLDLLTRAERSSAVGRCESADAAVVSVSTHAVSARSKTDGGDDDRLVLGRMRSGRAGGGEEQAGGCLDCGWPTCSRVLPASSRAPRPGIGPRSGW